MKEEEGGEDEDGTAGLFQDADFPADDSSLFSDYSSPIARLQDDITWLRPQEICSSPTLLPAHAGRGHATQGMLGDCWFLCACTILLKNKHLMDKVLPPGQPTWGHARYRGSFLLRLWRNGCWGDVTVDDRLPCIGGKLCFSRCQTPEAFWVALLEKAYAKLHGSYECLWAGQVTEALVDLTGGLAERWSLVHAGKEEECRNSDRVGRTTRRLDLDVLQAVREGCAVSCSTHSAPTGGSSEPQQYHALNVMEWLDVRTASGGAVGGAGGGARGGVVRLLRIRNPWGRRCGGGAWIEGGAGWSSVDRTCSLELLARAEDGEFWVDHTEFLSLFDDVTVGYPISEEGHLQSIYTGKLLTHSHQLTGRWVKGQSAGGCRNNGSYSSNPRFWLRVCERGEVLVSLLQHWQGGRAVQYPRPPAEGSTHTQQQRHQAIALHVWKVEKKRFHLSRTLNQPPCSSTPSHAYEREVVLHACLEPGFHLVIPSTFHQGAEASFTLRVFSSSHTTLSALKAPGPSLPSAAAEGEWETVCFRGAWVTGSSAGGSRNFLSHRRNPRFPVAMDNQVAGTPGVNVRVTLRQNCPDTDLQPIGFHLYTAPEREGKAEPTLPRDEEPVASCVPHCYTQDVSLACCLPPGTYLIVPSTYQPDCPGQFTLTVARRIPRRVVKIQECLGRAIQEVSHISVMPC